MTESYRPLREATQAEHAGMVRDIFATVPGRYDFLNRLLSLRRDVAWRRFTVRRLAGERPGVLLDLATGTGDLALEAAGQLPGLRVAGVDLMDEMLSLARGKVRRRGLEESVFLARGDAMSLPFPDGTFDAVTVAFGVRNLPDRPAALREMRRVLRPGGRLYVLEMTSPPGRIMGGLHRWYLTRVLPRLAGLFTPNPAAYSYLAESILAFPSPREFAAMLGEAGFDEVRMHPLTLGITWLHEGRRTGDSD